MCSHLYVESKTVELRAAGGRGCGIRGGKERAAGQRLGILTGAGGIGFILMDVTDWQIQFARSSYISELPVE